jgi:hypothetical protein
MDIETYDTTEQSTEGEEPRSMKEFYEDKYGTDEVLRSNGRTMPENPKAALTKRERWNNYMRGYQRRQKQSSTERIFKIMEMIEDLKKDTTSILTKINGTKSSQSTETKEITPPSKIFLKINEKVTIWNTSDIQRLLQEIINAKTDKNYLLPPLVEVKYRQSNNHEKIILLLTH